MKLFLFLFLNCSILFSALPPKVQDENDKENMKSLLSEYKNINIENINVQKKEIRLRNGCIVSFERKTSFHLYGWVGPAEKLKISNSTCTLK